MDSPPPQVTFRVAADDAGRRLDQVVAAAVPSCSRSTLQKWIKAGQVRVAGEPCRKPSTPLEGGEAVVVELGDVLERRTAPIAAADLHVVHEDEHLIVVDKPPGLVVHPNEKFLGGTLADLAEERFGPLPEVQGAARPGIVHRLDKDTSGLMVLGRTLEALKALKRQFKERRVRKTYLAVVHGVPRFDSDWIEADIAPNPKSPDRMRTVPAGEGRDARTFFEVLERFRGFSLLAAHPKTGRTHQIRVHLAAAGLPILFDRLYKPPGAVSEPYPDDAPQLGRQALHAHRLGFTHPGTGEEVEYRSEAPADFAAVIEWLRAERPGV